MTDIRIEKADQFIAAHDLNIAEIVSQPYLWNGIQFEKEDDGWHIRVYPRYVNTYEGETMILLALSSILRRESPWFTLPTLGSLLSQIEDKSGLGMVDFVYSRFATVLEMEYLVKNDYVSLEDVRRYALHIFNYMVDHSDAVESLACVAVLRAHEGDVTWITEEIVKRKRYGFLRVIDEFEDIFETLKILPKHLALVTRSLDSDLADDNGPQDLRSIGRKTLGPRGSSDFDYDVAISFAGEDRVNASSLASALTARGIKVFYDEFEKANLWGKDLYSHLSDVYGKRAQFCLMLISEHYGKKQWTNHERKAAQNRAFQENAEYILPLRLDDSTIPGLLDTVGYIDMRSTPVPEVVELVINKVQWGQ